MICIYCFHGKTTITNSRGHKKEASTWRRHACPSCGRLFSSLEKPAMADSYKVANETAGTDEPYSRTRLSASLVKSFGHLTDGSAYGVVDGLTDTIEGRLIATAYFGVISKDELGALAWEVVKNYDPVAGIQYAAQNGLVSAVKKRPGRPSIK